MIITKEDLNSYLKADRIALKVKQLNFWGKLIDHINPHHTLKFQKALRFAEYYTNKKKTIFEYPFYYYYLWTYKRLSVKYGFSIPLNVFGAGLAIAHIGTIVINSAVKVGRNCRIHICTNIGSSAGSAKAPAIGDNVYIAPGVKIYGDIKIVNNVSFAANAAVHVDCLEEGMLYGGVPAKSIRLIDNRNLIKHI